MNFFLVGIGGAIGSILRFAVSSQIMRISSAKSGVEFPWGTLGVNLLGCFLIGLFASLIESMSPYHPGARFLIVTGFLGGFTTFSAFGIESLSLLQAGEFGLLIGYVAGSVGLGLLLAALGMKLSGYLA